MIDKAGKSRIRSQQGLTYLEVMVSTIILGLALVPALSSLRVGIEASTVQADLTAQHLALISKMQITRAAEFESLVTIASEAGSFSTPTSLSDGVSVDPRALVYLSYYDVADSDGDGNPFTIYDPNTDGDNNPYTNASSEPPLSLLWVNVELAHTPHSLASLVSR